MMLSGRIAAALFALSTPEARAESVETVCVFDQRCSSADRGCISTDLTLRFVLDRSNGKALMIGKGGMAEVRAFGGHTAIGFVELFTSGALHFTTINVSGEAGHGMSGPAVHSHHGVVHDWVPADQYYGDCEEVER